MNIVFITSGLLSNEAPNKKSSNPWETHYFEAKIDFIDNSLPTEEILETFFYLTGDVPLNLNIDNTGKIFGTILTLDEQTHLNFNKYPKENIKLDGSNWLNNGRPKASSVLFSFMVNRKIIYKNLVLPDLGDGTNIFEIIVSTQVSINVIKNNNIDNYIFVKNYLKQGNILKIGNDDYTIDHLNLFVIRHPGPFGL